LNQNGSYFHEIVETVSLTKFCWMHILQSQLQLDQFNINIDSIGMEEAHGNYSQEDDIRGMDVHLGIEGTNSNGHGKGRDENMNIVETIKNL
jgi:hypothetical protein